MLLPTAGNGGRQICLIILAALPPAQRLTILLLKQWSFESVQELAQGKSLAQMVADEVRLEEAEVTRVAVELLAILDYLGSRKPPVTHRQAHGIDFFWGLSKSMPHLSGIAVQTGSVLVVTNQLADILT